MSRTQVKADERIAVIGMTGSGKSVYTQHLVKSFLKNGAKMLLYDPELQYTHLIRPANNKPAPSIYSNFHYTKYPNLLLYQPSIVDDREEFDKVAEWVFNTGDMVFIVESLGFFAKPQKGLTPSFKKCVHWGRGQGIGIIWTARRPSEVHKDAFQCRHLFLFHTPIPNDIKYLRDIIGDDAKELKDIPFWHYYHWTSTNLTFNEPINMKEALL